MTMRKKTPSEQENKRDIYLYNISQAQFFLEHGLCPKGVSKGQKGDVYLKFEHTEAAEAVWQLWNAHVQKMKSL